MSNSNYAILALVNAMVAVAMAAGPNVSPTSSFAATSTATAVRNTVAVLPEKQVVTLGDFHLVKTGEAPRQPTSATISWDSNALQVVFDCTDDAIVAGQTGRDNIKLWRDDSVYVWLDIGHKHDPEVGSLMVQVSAGGMVFDALNGDPNFNVEGLATDVTREDKGWKAVIRIPWSGLGISSPKSGDVWGLNLARRDQPDFTLSSWPAISNDAVELSMKDWGHIVFVAAGVRADGPEVAAARSAIENRKPTVERDSPVAPTAPDLWVREAPTLVGLPEKQVITLGDFHMVKTGEAPEQSTTAAVSWDNNALQVVFDCRDDAIVAEQTGRDNVNLQKDDCVVVWLDIGHTHDRETGNMVMVQVSAGGMVFDARNGDPSFNVEGLVADVTRTKKGWKASIRLPWSGLGVPCPKPGDVWGLNLVRMDQFAKSDLRKVQVSSWIAVPVNFWDFLIPYVGHVVFLGAGTSADGPEIAAARTAVDKAHQQLGPNLKVAGGDGSAALLLQSDFEQDPVKMGWYAESGGANDPAPQWARGDAHSGTRYLSAANGAWRSPMIPVKPGEYYLAEAWLRADGPGLWQAVFFNDNGVKIESSISLATAKGGNCTGADASRQWRRATMCFRAGRGVTHAQLIFTPRKNRMLAVDDVAVRSATWQEAVQWADWTYAQVPPVVYTPPTNRWLYLPRTHEVLERGGNLRMVMLGSSFIDDASRNHFELLIRKRNPKAVIDAIISTRGSTWCDYYQAPEQVKAYVLDYEPDVVVIDCLFGAMESIRSVVRQVRAGSRAEIILAAVNSKAIVDMANEEKVALLDMNPPFWDYENKFGMPEEFLRRDAHLNDRGKQVKGRILAGFFTLP